MKKLLNFIVDECTGPRISAWLRELGYDVIDIYDDFSGISDEEIILKASKEQRIIVTNDKDFGELVFKLKKPHAGIVLLRLKDNRYQNKQMCLSRLLENYAEQLPNNFTVVSEDNLRIIQL